MRTRLTVVVVTLLGLAGALLPLSPATAATVVFGNLPAGPVHGTMTISVTAAQAGSLTLGGVAVGSFPAAPSASVSIDTTKVTDGDRELAAWVGGVTAGTATITVDNTVPVVAVSSEVTWSQGGVRLGYTVTDAHPGTTSCSLQPLGGLPQWTSCTTSTTYEVVPPAYGTYTFSVQATDAAGNVSGVTSAAISYLAPTVGLEGIPTLWGPRTLNVAPTVTDFSPGQRVTLRMDGYDITSWTAPPFTTQTDPTEWQPGEHSLRVIVFAPSGAPVADATTTVVVDVTPPTVTVTPVSGNAEDTLFTTDRPPAWRIAATDPHGPVSTTCMVTAGVNVVAGPTDCTDGDAVYAPTGLPQGALTLTVLAADAAGNQSTRMVPLVVDTVGPVLSVRSAPDPFLTTRHATATFTSDNGLAGLSVWYDCTLDGEPLGCSADALDPDGDHVLTLSLSGISVGPHDLAIRAREVGNASGWQHLAFAVDATPPQVDVGPGLRTVIGPSVTLPYTATDQALASVACSLQPAGDAPVWQPCPDAKLTATVAPGTYLFLVSATDAAGNTSDDNAVVTVVAPTEVVPDRTAPIVRVAVAPRPKVHRHGRRSVAVRLGFRASEPAAYRCRVDAGPWRACPSSLVVRARQGRHVVQVVAVDAAGNTSAPAVVRWRVVR